ncbi:MAG TPA: hypothetical protein VKG24_28235 [Pseudolabrys sp.]|nr:hypothetical protein [Pseudolabrys sp.]
MAERDGMLSAPQGTFSLTLQSFLVPNATPVRCANIQACRTYPANVRGKMRQPGKMLILLVLAGCSSTDWFHQNEPVKPTVLPNQNSQAVPNEAAPQGVPSRSNLSPAASAAAPAAGTETSGELMDCVTESCRINCSPKVALRFRPKWCARFKEPSSD